MDQLLREGNPPTGQLASPKPQYKDVQTNSWEELKGEGGASYVKDKDVFASLEQARALLAAISGKDFATQTTLAAVLAKLADLERELATIKANQLSGDQKVQLSGASGNIISPATEDKLEQVRQLLSGVATENKLEQARALLEAISTKDFATSSKQDALNIAVEGLKSELILVKSELANIEANQLSGDQKVQLSGAVVDILLEINDRTQTNSVTYIGASISSATFPLDISGYKDVGIFINNKGSEMCKLWMVTFYSKLDVARHQQTPLYSDTNDGERWIIPAGSTLYLSKRSLERGSLPARGLILTFYDGPTWSTIIDLMVLGER
jgi:hypothetical protein